MLKNAKNIMGSVQQKKNLFVWDIIDNTNKIMITQERSRPTHLLGKDPEVRL